MPQEHALSIDRIGARLLSDDFQEVLEARRVLQALAQQPEAVKAHLEELVHGAEKAGEPAVHAALCALLKDAVCGPNGVEVLLSFASATVQTTSDGAASMAVAESADAQPSGPTIVRYLFGALDSDDTSIGCGAARAIVDILAVVVHKLDEGYGGGASSLAAGLRHSIASSVKLNHNLLRLLDDSEAQPAHHDEVIMLKHVAVLRVLRSVTTSGPDGADGCCVIEREGGASPLTQAPPTALPIVPRNVVDGYLLNDLVQAALAAEDVLLLVSALYAAGCILREAPHDPDGDGAACDDGPSKQVVAYLTTVIMHPDDHVLLFPFACRTIGVLCWRATRGAEIAAREHWAASLARFVLTKPAGAVGAASDLCPAWLALESLATTARGMGSIATTTQLLDAVDGGHAQADEVAADAVSSDCRIMAFGAAMERLAEDYTRRGDAASRVAMLGCMSQMLTTTTTANSRHAQCASLAVPMPFVVRFPVSMFRHIWTLRLNAEADVRRAVWCLVATCLRCVGEVASVVGPSCAAHLVSMEPEPDVAVRQVILIAVELCLRDHALSAFHERLAAVAKAGLYPPQSRVAVGSEYGQ